jgi:multiple sugar transport system ATP-binding protein
MSRVLLKKLSKSFDGKVRAVDGVDLEVKDEEFLVLVGPSGCGKSTILRLIAGLDEPTEGEIYIGDMKANDIPPKDRDVAMVFQNYALYPHMNVYGNLSFTLKLRKTPKADIEIKVRETAGSLGISALLDRKPAQLSGGEAQRVAVGRAIIRNPKVFLFDEPLSNLDAKLRGEMRAEILRLHRRLKATIIYVTHDQVEAMTMGDRIVILNKGKIQQIDDPYNLYNHPQNQFVASFIGNPSMNFVVGKVMVGQASRLSFNAGDFQIDVPDPWREKISHYKERSIALGIRPEHIEVGEDLVALVDVVEPMGNEIMVHLTVGKTLFIARFSGERRFEVGEKLRIQFNSKKLHFFNKETGISL